MTEVEKANQIVAETLDRVNGEKAKLQASLEKENAEIDQAKADMTKASDAGDFPAYQKAKEKLHYNEDAAEMHQTRLNKLEKEPMISDEEYCSTISAIRKEISEENHAAKVRLIELADEMSAIADDMESKINAANRALKRVQHDLYLDSDCRILPNWGTIAHGEQKISDWSACTLGREAVKSNSYKTIKDGLKAAKEEQK